MTIEVVAQITSAGATAAESQIAGLRGGNPDFMLTAVGSTDFRFFKPFGSVVLHLVFDTSRVTPSERIELLKNGEALFKTTSAPPGINTTVGLDESDHLKIGNRQQGDRSIAGTIFYVAFYNTALDATEIANKDRLLVDDDL